MNHAFDKYQKDNLHDLDDLRHSSFKIDSSLILMTKDNQSVILLLYFNILCIKVIRFFSQTPFNESSSRFSSYIRVAEML
jgi:hypothetical protein